MRPWIKQICGHTNSDNTNTVRQSFPLLVLEDTLQYPESVIIEIFLGIALSLTTCNGNKVSRGSESYTESQPNSCRSDLLVGSALRALSLSFRTGVCKIRKGFYRCTLIVSQSIEHASDCSSFLVKRYDACDRAVAHNKKLIFSDTLS